MLICSILLCLVNALAKRSAEESSAVVRLDAKYKHFWEDIDVGLHLCTLRSRWSLDICCTKSTRTRFLGLQYSLLLDPKLATLTLEELSMLSHSLTPTWKVPNELDFIDFGLHFASLFIVHSLVTKLLVLDNLTW